MKKKSFLIVTAVALCVIMLAGCITAFADTAFAASKYISKEKALQIALDKAGLKKSDVTVTKNKLDKYDRTPDYDIEFYSADTEYDFEIDAVTGEIISMETEKAAVRITPVENKNSNKFIGKTAAKNAALKHAAVKAADVKVTKNNLKKDDGRWIYDIEFYGEGCEYDYEIDALDGSVLSFDVDGEKTAAPASSGKITADKAKQIALKHAGLSESKVSRMKVKLDNDDGVSIYEVEWKVGGVEYNYDIEAATGKILKYEKEIDD